jgi:hypothetical protein
MNEKHLQQAIEKLLSDRDAAIQKYTAQIDSLKAAQKALKTAAQIVNGRTLRQSLPKITSNGNKISSRDPQRAANILARMREVFKPGEWFSGNELAAIAHDDESYIRYKITRPMSASGELERTGKLTATKYRIPVGA